MIKSIVHQTSWLYFIFYELFRLFKFQESRERRRIFIRFCIVNISSQNNLFIKSKIVWYDLSLWLKLSEAISAGYLLDSINLFCGLWTFMWFTLEYIESWWKVQCINKWLRRKIVTKPSRNSKLHLLNLSIIFPEILEII